MIGEALPGGHFAARSHVLVSEHELRPVTSLFADVVGSTSLGERLSPSEVKALIGECVTRMCEVIESFGGCVRSYMGDGVAGFFGIDTAREDDVERAARTALEIRRVMSTYAKDVESAWAVSDFNVRIGVNSGRVAVGPVGAADPQRVALGDAVNVAARLQSAARPGAIIVGASVASGLSNRFVLRSLGELVVRGRTATIEAYELEARERVDRGEVSAPYVGRSHELELLRGALEELGEGRGQVWFVLGDAGIGKTRLLNEIRVRASSELTWLEGICDPIDRRLPFEPLAQPLRSWLGIDDATSSIATRVRLNARARELLGDEFDDCAPYLARLLGVSLGPRLDHRLDGLPSDVVKAGLLRSYTTWLRTLSRCLPLVLAIDNVESASDGTVEFLNDVLAEVETSPILLLLVMRPDIRSPAVSARTSAIAQLGDRVVDIRLRPLNDANSAKLVRALDAENNLDERLKQLVVERAEGNPLYAEELVAAVAADPSLEGKPATLPGQLASLLVARIDRLPHEAKTLLQCAAVLGRSFKRDLLASIADVESFDQALGALLREDVIRENGRSPASFVFRHGLIRDAVLSTLSPQRQRDLNARAANALQTWAGFDLERDAECLAQHYLASGDLTQALACIERVSDRQALVFRWSEASGLLARCLDEANARGDQATLTRVARKQSQLLAMLGNDRAAIEVLDDALRRIDQVGSRRELILAKARRLTDAGLEDEADRTLTALLSHDEDARSDLSAITLAGQLALNRWDVDSAEACVRQLGDIEALVGELGFEAAILAAGVFACRGDLSSFETWSLHAQVLADQLGQISRQLRARRHAALVCLLKGCLSEAYELTKSVYSQCAHLGFTSGKMEAVVNLLHVGHVTGKLEESCHIGSEALTEDPPALLAGLISCNLATIQVARGNYREARALARRALSLEQLLPEWARTSARISLAYADSHDQTQLEAELLRIHQMAVENEWTTQQAVSASALATLYIEQGRVSEAATYSDQAHNLFGMVNKSVSGSIRRLCVQTSGEDCESRSHQLRSLLEEAQQTGQRLDEAHLCVALAEIDATNAEDYLARAERIFRDCDAMHYLKAIKQLNKGKVVASVNS